jgi:outer membrane cobalamin receptor
MVVALAGFGESARAAPVANPSPTTVGDVVVTAKRPAERVLLDRRVYTAAADLRGTTGTAADILNQIPSVDVDADGGISLRGDANVTVLIDGKPSAQFSGPARGLSLQQLPAQDIDRIEVMTNPPAQYKAEGSAGVINIVTLKTHRKGVSGDINASVGDRERFVVGANASYKIGKFDLSGGVTLRDDPRRRLITDDRTAVDPVTGENVASRETLDERLRRLIPSVKLETDYAFDSKRSVALTFSHRELSGNRYFDQRDSSGPAGGPADAISLRHSDGHEWSVDNARGVRFDQKLWRPGETLSLSIQRSASRERERYDYTNTALLPPVPDTFDALRLSLDLVTTEVSADYVLPFAGNRELKLGYDFEDDNNAFDNVGELIVPVLGKRTLEPDVTNHFRYRQRIETGYGEYQALVGDWTVQTGVRIEQTDVHTLQITGGIAGEDHYLRAYPTLNMERALPGDAKLHVSASRRINRPDPEALNPFTDYQDIHNLRAGNAKLRPQDTTSVEVGYEGAAHSLSYAVTGYFRLDRDSVTDVTQVVSADVVLSTKANLPKSKSGGVEFTASGKLLPHLTYRVSSDAFYKQIDAAALIGGRGLRSTIGLNAKASLDYKPTVADTFQVSFSRTDKRLTPQGYVDAINLVNLGYRRQLGPKLALVATVSDVLDGQRFGRVVGTATLHDVYQRQQLGRVALIGVVYSFGGSKNGRPGTFEYD